MSEAATKVRPIPRLTAAWLAWLATLVLAGAGVGLLVAIRAERSSAAFSLEVGSAVLAVAVAMFAARSVARWPSLLSALVLALAVLVEVVIASGAYARYALREGGLPAVEAAALVNFVALPAAALLASFAVFAGREYRPRGRTWRAVGAAAVAAAVVSWAALLLTPGPLIGFPGFENPLGVEALGPYEAVTRAAWLFVALAGAAVAGAAILRRRRLTRQGRGSWGFFRDFPRVLPYLRPYWRLAALSVGLLGVAVAVGLVSAWPLAILIDTVLGKKPLPSLLGFLGGWDKTTLLVVAVVGGFVITALENVIGVIQSYANTKLEQRMALDVRSDLFDHAQSLSQAFHDNARTGSLMYAINNQAHSVGAVTVAIPPLVQAVATLVGMFVITFVIDAELALIAVSVVPFVYWSTRYYAKHIEPRLYRTRNMEAQSLSIVHEAMAMLRVIAAFGRERHEHKRFRSQAEQAVDARIDVTVRETLFSLAVNVSTAVGTALVLGFGAWHVLQGKLSAGELLVVMSYVAAIYQPLEQITGTMANLQEQFIGMRMALDLLDTEPEIKDAPDAREIERAEGRVTFENVCFTYRRRAATLRDISFDAAPGSRVGIVGRTGAGKTTLVTLIPRFYDVGEGRILLDGQDIRTLTLASLRAQISVVHQHPMLFSGTIRDNIRYGRLEASEEEVEEATKAANAHDFISALPDGYDTELGEGGAQLSGGERQRISIARAFLKDAPILVLDEPTASIDSKTESVILDALDRLAVGRTTFIVAHRLATLGSPDTILLVEDGRILERGTREELLAQDGLFRQLHDAQTVSRRPRVLDPAADAVALQQADASPTPDIAVVDALQRLLQAPPESLERIAADPRRPAEARIAARVLPVLERTSRRRERWGRKLRETLTRKRS